MKQTLLLILTLFLVYCGNGGDPTVAGGSTDTGNTMVTGKIFNPNGSQDGTVVYLLPKEYNPVRDGATRMDTTDAQGGFEFPDVPSGAWNVYASRTSNRTGALAAFSGNTVQDTLEQDASAIVRFADTVFQNGAYVYFAGTMAYGTIDSTARKAIIHSVPSGDLPSLYYAVSQNRATPILLAKDTVVLPGDTLEMTARIPRLEGTWTGNEIDGLHDICTITFQGNRVSYMGSANYGGTFAVNDTLNPRTLTLLVDSCSYPQYIGLSVLSIYKIEEDSLTWAGNIPGSTEQPVSFIPTGTVRVFKCGRR